MPAFRSHDLVGNSASLPFIPSAANYRFPPCLSITRCMLHPVSGSEKNLTAVTRCYRVVYLPLDFKPAITWASCARCRALVWFALNQDVVRCREHQEQILHQKGSNNAQLRNRIVSSVRHAICGASRYHLGVHFRGKHWLVPMGGGTAGHCDHLLDGARHGVAVRLLVVPMIDITGRKVRHTGETHSNICT